MRFFKQVKQSPKIKWLLALLFWLGLALIAFYWFFWRLVKPFDHQVLYPNGMVNEQPVVELMQQVLSQSMTEPLTQDVVIFHWLNFDCECSLLARLFVESLSRKTLATEVLHIVLMPPDTDFTATEFNLPSQVKVLSLSSQQYVSSLEFIPAAPAATIYYPKQQSLSYLGPHSSGVTCGQGTNYIELVVNNLAYGFDPKLYELETSGCFCSW